MNTKILLRGGLLGVAISTLAWAQPAQNQVPASDPNRLQTRADTREFSDFAPQTGQRELTFGGSGGSNRSLSDSFGGITASYGMFINERWQAFLRQSINYSNPNNGPRSYNGATKLGALYHFPTGFEMPVAGAVVPVLGLNFGRQYGSNINDTWAAGIEGGLKAFVHPRTFVYVLVEYSWLFRNSREIDNNFSDGGYTWSTGVGFRF